MASSRPVSPMDLEDPIQKKSGLRSRSRDCDAPAEESTCLLQQAGKQKKVRGPGGFGLGLGLVLAIGAAGFVFFSGVFPGKQAIPSTSFTAPEASGFGAGIASMLQVAVTQGIKEKGIKENQVVIFGTDLKNLKAAVLEAHKLAEEKPGQLTVFPPQRTKQEATEGVHPATVVKVSLKDTAYHAHVKARNMEIWGFSMHEHHKGILANWKDSLLLKKPQEKTLLSQKEVKDAFENGEMISSRDAPEDLKKEVVGQFHFAPESSK